MIVNCKTLLCGTAIVLVCAQATAQTETPTGSMSGTRANHTATLLLNGKVLVTGGYAYPASANVPTPIIFAFEGPAAGGTAYASAELYDPATSTWSITGGLTTARFAHTATLLTDGRVLVAGGADNLGSSLASAEIYDPSTAQWSPAGSLKTARTGHTATLLPGGKVLVAGGQGGTHTATTSAELYDPASNTWSPAGNLTGARAYHTATLLAGGKVIVAGGGTGATSILATAEVYDPASNAWSAAGSLNVARALHTATRLPSGQLLVAGGVDGSGAALASAELYNPIANVWTATASLQVARLSHAATLLPGGRVMISGGQDSNGIPPGPYELYDPAVQTWSYVGDPTFPDNLFRALHTATLLASGQVLLAGGYFTDQCVGTGVVTCLVNSILVHTQADATLFNPSTTASWLAAPNLSAYRFFHTSTLLPAGKVLVAGGYGGSNGTASELAGAEIYDPPSNTWSPAHSLTTAREGHTATLLANGRVLIAGGYDGTSVLASVELYDPATDTWSPAAPLTVARIQHTATLLPNGSVLVCGGFDNPGLALASAEVYNPATNAWSPAGPMTTARGIHTATLLTGGRVLIAGGTGDSAGSTQLATAELYDPASGTWSVAASMTTGRLAHTATLLPSGQVFVAGGYTSIGVATLTFEAYDPATNTWLRSPYGSMMATRAYHTATLLPSGKVLVAGGDGSGNASGFGEICDPSGFSNPLANSSCAITGSLNASVWFQATTLLPNGTVLVSGGHDSTNIYSTTVLYRSDPGAATAWYPALVGTPSQVALGAKLSLSGSLFTGQSEASGGNGSQNSASNYPLAMLQRLDNGQQVWLGNDLTTPFTSTSLTTAPVSGIAPGPAMVTVFVNGLASPSMLIVVADQGPVLQAVPSSLSFGGQLVATTSAGQTVAVTNVGTGSLSISTIAATGDFGEGDNCTAAALPPGGSCVVTVTFVPTMAGPRTGVLVITSNATGSPTNVGLSGTGLGATAPLLTVATSGSATGTVTSNPPGISCGSACTATLAGSVTLTATPAAGYVFAGWTGACSGTGACSVDMAMSRNVAATFAVPVTPGTGLTCVPINTLPALITAPGVYCLNADFAVAQSAGNAITVNANNVTLDFQNYKIGALAAGTATTAVGVYAFQRQNITVRNGILRGFMTGIWFDDTQPAALSQGHLVERMNLDQNRVTGIEVTARGSVIRSNQVVATGGTTAFLDANGIGIAVSGANNRVLDNDVTNTSTVGNGSALGISASNAEGLVVSKNRVSGFTVPGTGGAFGIHLSASPHAGVRRNTLSIAAAGSTSVGVFLDDPSDKYERNLASGFAIPYSGGTAAGSTNY